MKNLYTVLGVDDQAEPEELRRAWLRLAVKYHPDRNPGDARAEERFKDISQAYAILSDPAARSRYERTRPPKAQPKPEPQARPSAPRPEPRPGPQGAAHSSASGPQGPSQPGASPRPEPRSETHSSASGPRPAEPSDWAETLNSFFQTPKGRDTLRELEEELRRAGLKLSSGRLAHWLRNRRSPAAAARLWLERARSWLPGGSAWARRRAARYDIDYDLALAPEVAARGTTVEITYPRDGRPQELKVNIPAGLKNGARLRLADQGRLRPDGGRGDLVLTLLVGPRTSVSDLWPGA
jgi:curved DNA-binding protein CbpA